MRQMARIGLIVALIVAAGSVQAGGLRFSATLSGAQSVPTPNPGEITGGRAVIVFDEGFTQARVRLEVDGAQNVTAAHFHCGGPGTPGPVTAGLIPAIFALENGVAEGVLTNDNVNSSSCPDAIGRPLDNLVSLALAMRDGLIYLNVHTTDNPPGEVRGQMLEARGHGRNDGDDDDDDDDDRHGHGHSLIGQVTPESPYSGSTRKGLQQH